MSAFKRVTDPAQIRETMDLYMRNPPHTFIVEIFSREHRPGGIIYEGARPISACQSDAGRSYAIANSDTNYQFSLAVLDLSKIEYLSLLS